MCGKSDYEVKDVVDGNGPKLNSSKNFYLLSNIRYKLNLLGSSGDELVC
jgi:hypothetical protein